MSRLGDILGHLEEAERLIRAEMAAPPPPSGSRYPLLVSESRDHSEPRFLNGAILDSAKSYAVFLSISKEDSASVQSVEFLLDGVIQHTEREWRYDMAGSNQELANLRSFPDGVHTVTAVIRLQDGSTETVEAMYEGKVLEEPGPVPVIQFRLRKDLPANITFVGLTGGGQWTLQPNGDVRLLTESGKYYIQQGDNLYVVEV